MKILCVCGTGQGSSLILRMSIEEMLKERKLKADVEHADVSIACGDRCDYIVTSREIAGSITNHHAKIYQITNYINKKKLGEELAEMFNEIAQSQK
ncbi:MAG: PTS sugar transporter subunit IIB [Bacillota bacterium]|nr:PTS sugar transporter subunit IIB [Bacillota bacterium]